MKTKIKKLAILVMACAMTFSVLTLTGCNDETQDDPTDVTESSETDIDENDVTEPVDVPINLENVYEPALMERLNKSFTIDGNTITQAEYNFFYVTAYTEFSTYAYAGYYPATYSGFLDLEADCEYLADEGGKWGDFLDTQVKREIQKVYIMNDLAQDVGLALTEEDLESMDATVEMIENEAQANSIEADRYLAQHYGEDMSIALFTQIMEKNFLANSYYDYYLSNYEFDEDEVMLPTVRHILFPAEREAAEDEIAEARSLAEDVMSEVSEYQDMVLVGDRETTAERAAESAEYTVQLGQLVQELDDWCFDSEREEGDLDIIQTRFGFHVVYFVGMTEASETQKARIAEATLSGILDERATSDRFILVPA